MYSLREWVGVQSASFIELLYKVCWVLGVEWALMMRGSLYVNIHFGENHLNILKEGNKIKQTKVNLDAGCDADSQVSIII